MALFEVAYVGVFYTCSHKCLQSFLGAISSHLVEDALGSLIMTCKGNNVLSARNNSKHAITVWTSNITFFVYGAENISQKTLIIS